MRILLHPGAKGAGSARFVGFLDANAEPLSRGGIAVWTPTVLADGRLDGLVPRDVRAASDRRRRRATGRLRLRLDALAQSGYHTLVLSAPQFLGTDEANLRERALFPGLTGRLEPLAPAFEGHLLTVAIGIRAYEDYWTALLVRALGAGRPFPDERLIDHLTTQPRRWRTRVTRIADALPSARLQIWTAERHGDRPAALLERLLGRLPTGIVQRLPEPVPAPTNGAIVRSMADRGQRVEPAGPDQTRWCPFGPAHIEMLRAEYRRDLAWLRAGAEGRAQFLDGVQSPTPRPDRGRVNQSAGTAPRAVTGGLTHGDEKGLGSAR